MTLSWIDYAVVLIPFTVILLISWSTRRYMKSVADFMSASRCGGRYLLATAAGEAAMGAVSVVAIFEYTYKAGFAMSWWQMLNVLVALLIALTGFCVYRFRETRAMTLAQFFEVRYSRKFRVFAGIMAFVSGVLNYGIFPAVGARFFVNYCGFPQSLSMLGVTVPTFGVLMFIFTGFALFLTLMGGQLTIMVSDTLQGLLAGIFYLIVIGVLLYLFSWSDISQAMSNVPKGQSMLNPFDTAEATDFNIWYVLIGLFGLLYNTLGWQGGQGFRSAAASPHEAKMGVILGNWRSIASMVTITLLGICAFTYMTHPHFAAGAAQVNAQLQTIDGGPQIQSQMTVPVALSHLLPVGIKGVFAAIVFFAMVACDSSYMHSWGGIFIQDVVVPLRRKPLTPKQHIRLLRWGITGVAIFAFLFGLFYQQTDYILMFFAITGAIFLGGSGCAILGGLYWKKGTTAGAWMGMITGSVLAVGGLITQQVWKSVSPTLVSLLNPLAGWGMIEPVQSYLLTHAEKFPLNGQVIFFVAMFSSLVVYVTVSLLTCKEDFNLDRMLHRGQYSVEGPSPASTRRKWTWGSIIGFDQEFTRGDKIVSGSLFAWGLFWFLVFVVMSVLYLIRPWPLSVWATYWHFYAILIPIFVGVVTTVWFTWGGTRDLFRFFRDLPNVKRDALDDGSVLNHHNSDDERPAR